MEPPPPKDKAAERRYVAVVRHVYFRQFIYLAACWAAVAGIVAVHVLVVTPVLVPMLTSLSLPIPITVILALLPAVIGLIVVPGFVQVLATPRSERAAFEALSAQALLDRARWLSSAGAVPRAFRNAREAQRWIDQHPTTDPLQKVRVLVWGGRYAEATDIIERLPSDSPIWRAHRVALTALVNFVRDDDRAGPGLQSAADELAMLPASPDRDYAILTLALERARLLHANRGPVFQILAGARDRLGTLPPGASTNDRRIAGMRSMAPIIVVVALAAALVSLR